MKTLLLIDANSLIHRAYHALPLTLTNSDGEPVNAVYGFATMLLDVLLKFTPSYVACAFDSKGPTFRHKEYQDYKAHRPQTDEDLGKQFTYVKELLKALNIPVIEEPGYEADDIIGTIAKQLENNNLIDRILILTNDKDLFQLVTSKVNIIAPVRHFKVLKIIDPKGVEEILGITPKQVVDYKALVGDPSDNIPGVRGIGPKTAVDLLSKFNTLDSIYKNLPEIQKTKPSVARKLDDDKTSALLSRELATIKTDVPIVFNIEDAKLKEFNYTQAYNYLINMQFKSLISKLSKLYTKLTGQTPTLNPTPTTPSKLPRYATNIQTIPLTLNNLIDLLKPSSTPRVILFTPQKILYSTNLNKKAHKTIQQINTAFQNTKPIAVDTHPFTPITHQYRFKKLNTFTFGLLNAIQTVVENEPNKQDALMQIISTISIPIFDIQLTAYALITGRNSYTLEDIVMMYLHSTVSDQQLLDAVLKIAHMQTDELASIIKLGKVPHLLAMIIDPYVLIATVEMHTNGICLDTIRVQEYAKELNSRLAKLEKDIHGSVGFEFNVRSTKQLAHVLFEVLQLSPVKKRKTGYSTDIETLTELKGQHPVIDLILEYRKLQKIYSTYIKPFLKVNLQPSSPEQQPSLFNIAKLQDCIKIHSDFNPIKTSTGRLASSNPNLQNLPIRTEEGAKIRTFFIPEPGHKFISLDYSQIDLRVLAHTSQDPHLIEAFRNNRDIHRETASKIFNKPYEEITPQERRVAKTINFGIVYGMSPYGLSKTLGIDYHDAEAFLDTYFAQFPKVKEYITKVEEFVIKHGYVLSLFGRRRYITGITSHNANRRQAAIREAINMPIQGGSDDIIRKAIKDIYERFEPIKKREVRLILQIHDELVFQVPDKGDEYLKDIAHKLQKIMQDVVKHPNEIAVPLKVEYNIKKSV